MDLVTKVSAPRITLLEDPLHPDRSRRNVLAAVGQWLSEAVAPLALRGDWVAVENGKVINRDKWDQHFLVPGADILLYPRLADNPTEIALGVLFPPLGIYFGMRAAGAPAWVSLLTMGAFGGALGSGLAVKMGIDGILTGASRPPSIPSYSAGTGDMEGSPTYGFNGIEVA